MQWCGFSTAFVRCGLRFGVWGVGFRNSAYIVESRVSIVPAKPAPGNY